MIKDEDVCGGWVVRSIIRSYDCESTSVYPFAIDRLGSNFIIDVM